MGQQSVSALVQSGAKALVLGEGTEVISQEVGLKTEFLGDPRTAEWLTWPMERKFLFERYGIALPLPLAAAARRAGSPIILTEEGRARHIYVIGSTGVGKSELLRLWIRQDLAHRHGLGLIDPAADLFQKVIRDTVAARVRPEQVVLFDLTDYKTAVGFNPLEPLAGVDPSALASELVLVFKKIWQLDEAAAPRLLRILRHSLVTLIENELTLLEIKPLLTSPSVRSRLVSRLSVGSVARDFWETEFEPLPTNAKVTWTESTLNKVDAFLFDPRIRAVLGQKKSGLNLRQIMDEGQILLVNLAKGQLKDSAYLLGALLVAKLQMAAMSRASMQPAARKPWTLYVDEFQNFATESFSEILSEARKYGLRLVLAHQDFGQLPESLKHSILANAETQVYFRVNAEDAQRLVPEAFQPTGKIISSVEIEWADPDAPVLYGECLWALDEEGNNLYIPSKEVEEYRQAASDYSSVPLPTPIKTEVDAELIRLYESGKILVRDPVTNVLVRASDWFPPVRGTGRYGELITTFQYSSADSRGAIFVGLSYAFTTPVVRRLGYYSVRDELTAYVGSMVNLRRRETFVKFKGEPVRRMRTQDAVEPEVEAGKLRKFVSSIADRISTPLAVYQDEIEKRRAQLAGSVEKPSHSRIRAHTEYEEQE